MIKFIYLLFFALFLSCGSSEAEFETGKRQLEHLGYIDVKNIGYVKNCCSRFRASGFSCKDKNGNTTIGCFCGNTPYSFYISYMDQLPD